MAAARTAPPRAFAPRLLSTTRSLITRCSRMTLPPRPCATDAVARHFRRPWARPSVPEQIMRLAADDTEIRPFQVNVPERRSTISAGASPRPAGPTRRRSPIARRACRWQSCRSWCATGATDYDWRKAEAKLNALPQFMTEIDGVDIHFIHVRSRHPNALPLIITHGWPGSVIEQLKIIGPLTDPTAHGGTRRGRLRRRASRRCRATASPASRPAPAGTPTTSRAPGPS